MHWLCNFPSGTKIFYHLVKNNTIAIKVVDFQRIMVHNDRWKIPGTEDIMNNEWEKFGKEIRNIVEDAVNAQDFRQLNRTITKDRKSVCRERVSINV